MYEWAGGHDAFARLTAAFYDRVLDDRVLDDRLLAPLFSHLDPDHPEHVAVWLSEVFGGPARYTAELGGYEHMVAKHHGLAITEPQRARWAGLIALAADDAGLPTDPEFRSAFAAYIEWGTRLAVANSQPDATPPPHAPVPRWGWGEAPPPPGSVSNLSD